MNKKYIFYIAKLINIYGMCAEHTLAMQQKFPELVRIRGHYDCPLNGKICHWWLVAPNGEIVDPTVSQFITKGCGAEYIPWNEEKDEPTGKCLHCGELVYKNNYFCSNVCVEAASTIYNIITYKKEMV